MSNYRLYIKGGTLRHYLVPNINNEQVVNNADTVVIMLLSGETPLISGNNRKFLDYILGKYYQMSMDCPVAYQLQIVEGKLEVLNELHILPALLETGGNSIVKLIEGKPVFIEKKEHD